MSPDSRFTLVSPATGETLLFRCNIDGVSAHKVVSLVQDEAERHSIVDHIERGTSPFKADENVYIKIVFKEGLAGTAKGEFIKLFIANTNAIPAEQLCRYMGCLENAMATASVSQYDYSNR